MITSDGIWQVWSDHILLVTKGPRGAHAGFSCSPMGRALLTARRSPSALHQQLVALPAPNCCSSASQGAARRWGFSLIPTTLLHLLTPNQADRLEHFPSTLSPCNQPPASLPSLLLPQPFPSLSPSPERFLLGRTSPATNTFQVDQKVPSVSHQSPFIEKWAFSNTGQGKH